MTVASHFIPNFEMTELSGKLFLSQNYEYLRENCGLYVIRNPVDREEHRYKIGMGLDMIDRINSYYTYFPDGVDIVWACAMAPQTRSQMMGHERDLWERIIISSGGNVNFQMNFGRVGRHRVDHRAEQEGPHRGHREVGG